MDTEANASSTSVSTGENNAGAAVPQEPEGSTVQEGTETGSQGTGVNETGAAAPSGDSGTQQQTPEQNAAFAAARREAEQKARDAEQRAASAARTVELIQKYGAENGCYSDADVEQKFGVSNGIHSLEDLAKAVENQRVKEQTGIDPSVLSVIVNKLVEENPAIKAAKEAQSASIAQKQINEFKAAFPDVKFDPQKGVEQFENADSITGYLKRGLSMADAYRLANWKSIQSKSSAAGKQSALNGLSGKDHLNATGNGVDISNVQVPAAVRDQYRQLFPKWTDKQIADSYAKSLND